MTTRKFKPSDFVCRTNDSISNGTCLQGEFSMYYADLVKLLGEPGEGDGYKVAFEWRLIGPGGIIATIYDYKDTSLYDDDLPAPAQIRSGEYCLPIEWHIGGHGPEAVRFVRDLLDLANARGRV